MPETTRDLIERAQRDGWTEGLAYHYARLTARDPEDMLVCVRCGWAWVGPSNRCVNRECGGFCTWGEKHNAPPTSWLPTGPRPVGMPDHVWRQAWEKT